MSDAIEFDTKALDTIIKSLKKVPVARVGILGSGKNGRSPEVAAGIAKGTSANSRTKARAKAAGADGLSNASIGAAHEYGSPSRNLPMRSFLRVPLYLELDKQLQKAGALDETTLKKVVAEGSAVAFMKKVAIVAHGIVLQAFDTGGFGTWAPLKDKTMNAKQNKQILVETHQLRDSVTWEVKAT